MLLFGEKKVGRVIHGPGTQAIQDTGNPCSSSNLNQWAVAGAGAGAVSQG